MEIGSCHGSPIRVLCVGLIGYDNDLCHEFAGWVSGFSRHNDYL